MQNEQLQQLDERFTQTGEMPQIPMDQAVKNAGVTDHNPAEHIHPDPETARHVTHVGEHVPVREAISGEVYVQEKIAALKEKDKELNSLPKRLLAMIIGLNPFTSINKAKEWELIELSHRKEEQLKKNFEAQIPKSTEQNISTDAKPIQILAESPQQERALMEPVQPGKSTAESDPSAQVQEQPSQVLAQTQDQPKDTIEIHPAESANDPSNNSPVQSPQEKYGKITQFPTQQKSEEDLQHAA